MKTLSFLLVLVSTTTFSQSLLWKVSGNGLKKPSYLFGTYHIMKDSYLNQNPKIKSAYEGAEGVVVETEVDSSAMLSMAMRGLMLDKSLDKLLSQTDYKLVADEFKKGTGYDLALFNQMKPIVTATMLSLAYVQKESDTLNSFTGLPLDLYFASDGRKRRKTVSALETMEEQMAFLFDHDPVEKQAQHLVEMVKEKDEMHDMSKSVTELYLKQDLQGMWKLNEKSGNTFGNMTYLLDERNHNWMKRLPGLMASRPTFVAVGALHLPGPQGLIELLKKEGYQVEPQ
ncbi:TraB/GumN family protein [Larkinella humicola]|uniref:TraB/GumN family protein n=1 Tax=Larkinella humicola TaxID=2607654 RepID=A0A5N1J7K7_9BACT|nr:TraB/GumN family protein [Larkinella humicola]KAA9346771.1 TraB/GumN family protein [Larkinella humicola]